MGAPAFTRGLNLTADQQTKLRDVMRASRDKIGPLADELQFAQSTLRREAFADTPDSGKVTEFAAKVSELRSRIAAIRQETTLSIAAILTPEQRAAIRAGGGRGPGRGFGPGPARGRDRDRNG
jgi:Spy/CpxP family protein refolding chaperone